VRAPAATDHTPIPTGQVSPAVTLGPAASHAPAGSPGGGSSGASTPQGTLGFQPRGRRAHESDLRPVGEDDEALHQESPSFIMEISWGD